MAFVYERVGEENRELWESIGWKNWGKNKLPFFKLREWSINRERQVYLQGIGGYIDMPYYYDLSYKGRIIRMEVVSWDVDESREEGKIIYWKINRIYIPKSIWEEKDNVIRMIREACSVVEIGNPTKKILEVIVKIQSEPECVEADYNGN